MIKDKGMNFYQDSIKTPDPVLIRNYFNLSTEVEVSQEVSSVRTMYCSNQ